MTKPKKSPRIVQPKYVKKLSISSEPTGDVNKGTNAKRVGGVQSGDNVNTNFSSIPGTFT